MPNHTLYVFLCWVRDLHSRSPSGRMVYSHVRLTTPPTQQSTIFVSLEYSAKEQIKKVLSEPTGGFEPSTFTLQKCCSTTELCRHALLNKPCLIYSSICNFTRRDCVEQDGKRIKESNKNHTNIQSNCMVFIVFLR